MYDKSYVLIIMRNLIKSILVITILFITWSGKSQNPIFLSLRLENIYTPKDFKTIESRYSLNIEQSRQYRQLSEEFKNRIINMDNKVVFKGPRKERINKQAELFFNQLSRILNTNQLELWNNDLRKFELENNNIYEIYNDYHLQLVQSKKREDFTIGVDREMKAECVQKMNILVGYSQGYEVFLRAHIEKDMRTDVALQVDLTYNESLKLTWARYNRYQALDNVFTTLPKGPQRKAKVQEINEAFDAEVKNALGHSTFKYEKLISYRSGTFDKRLKQKYLLSKLQIEHYKTLENKKAMEVFIVRRNKNITTEEKNTLISAINEKYDSQISEVIGAAVYDEICKENNNGKYINNNQ